MTTGMMTKTITLTTLLTAIAFSSCAPQVQDSKSSYLDNSETELSSSNIVGGTSADSKYQKQNGIVQLKMKSSQGISTCTGSLIAQNIVLTAAHCLASPGLQSVAVLFSLTDKNVKGHQIIAATTGTIHHEYDNFASDVGVQHDIALLKLEKNAPVDFKLATLPKPSQIGLLKVGDKLTFAGFGITNAIVRKQVKDALGRERVLSVPSTGAGTLRMVDNIVVTSITPDAKEISLDQSQGKGACHGDSGGPALLKQSDGSLLLVGVTSRGTENLGNCNVGVIYTGVLGHLDWIASESAKLQNDSTTTVAAK